jgi:hypothetical protein
MPKRPKKKGKARAEIKKEAVDKHPRSAGSAEPNKLAKRELWSRQRRKTCYILVMTLRTIYLS